MAQSFEAFAVPDSHVVLLHRHLGLVDEYLEGNPPNQDIGPIPSDWPTQQLESLGSWGINHRNADLYHWILNGGPELVNGAGSIFQTWYEPDQCPAVLKLDEHNERFAFRAPQLAELATLLKSVDTDQVYRSFCNWLTSQGKASEHIDLYACEPFVEEFGMFAQGIELAIKHEYGLIW